MGATVWRNFLARKFGGIIMGNTCRSGSGLRLRKYARRMRDHFRCYCRRVRRQAKSWNRRSIRNSGCFWTRRQRALPGARARIRFWSALRGGMRPGCRSSSSSCAISMRAFVAAGTRRAHGEAAHPGHVQWEKFRLAIARNSLSHDASDPRRHSKSTSGFAASRAPALASAARLGAPEGPRTPRARRGRSALDWTRHDDIDSSLIPQMYFDFLRGGPAEPLAGIFRHNQMDLRGLAALAGKIFTLLDSGNGIANASPPDMHDPVEVLGLSRMLHRRGHSTRARELYESALRGGLPRPVERLAQAELAFLAKKELDYTRAASLWDELRKAPKAAWPSQSAVLAEDARKSVETAIAAAEQLAIYYEHRVKQPQRAAELIRAAITELRDSQRTGGIAAARASKIDSRLAHRLARLERRGTDRKRKNYFPGAILCRFRVFEKMTRTDGNKPWERLRSMWAQFFPNAGMDLKRARGAGEGTSGGPAVISWRSTAGEIVPQLALRRPHSISRRILCRNTCVRRFSQ